MGIVVAAPVILVAWCIAALETRSNGFFFQKRIGKDGRPFTVIKIKTMDPSRKGGSTVTTKEDPRITRSGRWFRRWKIDELPQLINVLRGEMSFVGPRPDVPGFADRLEGEDRVILSLRPGITGPATLKYRNEEELLASQRDPERYNREVIWPDKVRINREYLEAWSLKKDLWYLWKTIRG
jgi:lipopolysaccharide/colanic/teichoic acid biosynthesis glycosyltransferase